MFNIIIFGPPGSGKGTQAEKLVEKYNLIHLSTGNLLRSEIDAESPLGLEAKKFMDEGLLVPDEVVIGMIGSKLDEHKDAEGFIFDGFPRTVDQAIALDKLLEFKDAPISNVLALQVSNEELTKRLLNRGKTSGRTDDTNEEKISTRIEEYELKTKPVADYYNEQEKLVEVFGENSIDETFEMLSTILDKKH